MPLAQPTDSETPIFFAPDLDPCWDRNPGLLTAVSDLYPTKKGSLKSYRAARDAANTTYGTAFGGKPITGRVVEGYDGTMYTVVAGELALYKYDGNVWTNISRGGNQYLSPPTVDWCIANQGTDVIAVTKTYLPQISNIGAIGIGSFFTDLAGSPPKASAICVQKNFVMLGDCNDGVNDYGDMWWCCGIGNNTTWTPDAATEAAKGRLTETPGKIISLVPMRDFIVAYKRDSITILEYQGPPAVWSARVVAHNIGCGALHGVAVIGDSHYFIHRTNVYRFDGSSVQALGDAVSSYFVQQCGAGFGYEHCATDEQNGLIFWYGKTTAAANAAFGHALVYNLVSGKFGWVTHPAVDTDGVTALPASCTIQGSSQQVYNKISNVIGHALVTSPLTVTLGAYGVSTGMLVVAGHGAAPSSITTGFFGDDSQYSRVQQVTPRCLVLTSLANGSDAHAARVHAAPTTGTLTTDAARARWSCDINDRWHQITLPMTGVEIDNLTVRSMAVPSE